MLQSNPAPAPEPPPPAKWVVAAVNPLKPSAFFVGWADNGPSTTTRWAGHLPAARVFDSYDEAATEAALVAPSYRSRWVQPYRITAAAEG